MSQTVFRGRTRWRNKRKRIRDLCHTHKKHTSSRTKLGTHAHITYATAKPKRFCRKKTEGPSVCKVYRKYCVFFSPCLHGKVFFTTERGFLFTLRPVQHESGAFLMDVSRVVWFVVGMVSSPPALRRVLKRGTLMCEFRNRVYFWCLCCPMPMSTVNSTDYTFVRVVKLESYPEIHSVWAGGFVQEGSFVSRRNSGG